MYFIYRIEKQNLVTLLLMFDCHDTHVLYQCMYMTKIHDSHTLYSSCNNVAPVTNLCLGRATTRSHSSQWSKTKVPVET